MQAQIQALITGRTGEEAATTVLRPNIGSNIEVAKLQILNGKVGKVLEFLTACKLFIRMRMRDVTVEKQIQWMLLYVQGAQQTFGRKIF